MILINLLGGPGCGKSTTAAGLFYLMKVKEYKVELIREYIKDAVYENRDIFSDQIYIFGKQNRRQYILQHKVDWAITDSPILLSAVYAPKNYYPAFSELCLQTFDSYNNLNILLKRVKPYVNLGRNQTEKQAIEIDNRVETFMLDNKIMFHRFDGDLHAPKKIFNFIKDIDPYFKLKVRK